jgi:diacylglycerol kinase family enzyme
MRVAPDAGLDRPLTAFTLRTMRLGPVLTVAASALGSGRRARTHPQVSYRHDLDELRIVGYRPVPYQVDGDYLGEATELAFRHHPDVLRLVVPA